MELPSFPDRAALEAYQLGRLNTLLTGLGSNPFWGPRIAAAGLADGARDLHEYRTRMPLLSKEELAADQLATPPYGTNLTEPLARYVRFHQTSSTTGEPLRWLDTQEDWDFMVERWVEVFRAADLCADDRFFFAFSFGPFIGLWLGFEAAQRLGCLTLSGGAMDSLQRLQVMAANEVTALGCTPTYAMHLGEIAREEGITLPRLRTIVVGGEPGASLPAVRKRLLELWPGATLHDHHGMTEVGACTLQTATEPEVLHVMETGFLAEVHEPDADGLGELVLTTLGRPGRPVLRYRTRDLVRADGFDPAPRPYLRLKGGIRARADQMIVVRGVNVYPTAVDELVRSVDGVAEYQVEVDRRAAMIELRLIAEPDPGHDAAAVCASLERAFREAWNLRVRVDAAAPGELPRFELKARRWGELSE
jgi:phenylacetate-CoA ligase